MRVGIMGNGWELNHMNDCVSSSIYKFQKIVISFMYREAGLLPQLT